MNVRAHFHIHMSACASSRESVSTVINFVVRLTSTHVGIVSHRFARVYASAVPEDPVQNIKCSVCSEREYVISRQVINVSCALQWRDWVCLQQDTMTMTMTSERAREIWTTTTYVSETDRPISYMHACALHRFGACCCVRTCSKTS